MIQVGTARQLFFDDYIIEDTVRVRRTFHAVHKHPGNPLVTGDRPWEAGGPIGYGSVLWQDGTWRMWYNLMETNIPEAGSKVVYRIAYAESKDGLNWQKPSLGLVEYEGATDNNLVMVPNMIAEGKTMTGPIGSEGFCIREEAHDLDPDKRYKALYLTEGPGVRGICLAFSPDGLRWRPYTHNPVIWGWSDHHNNFFFDPRSGMYVLYMRPVLRVEPKAARRVARAESPDLTHWSMSEIVLRADELDFDPLKPPEQSMVQLYGMNVFPYEDIYIGLVKVYDIPRGTIHIELAFSRDNHHWMRPPHRPLFIPLGVKGQYNACIIHPMDRPIPMGNELWFYFGAFSFPHYAWTNEGLRGIGLGTLRRDGFVSLEAKEAGIILTRPFICDGDRLMVNARVDVQLGVEVQDLTTAAGETDRTYAGRTYAGYSREDCYVFQGDSVNEEIRWRGGDLSQFRGWPIRLRFYLTQGELYAFWMSKN